MMDQHKLNTISKYATAAASANLKNQLNDITMSLFSNLFGKKNKDGKDSSAIFYAKPDSTLDAATLEAQKHFKYFWRELYWEYRRIVPAHSFAMVKMPFAQKIDNKSEPVVEHMWINNIGFDGELITGELVNEPKQLTNISVGDPVTCKVSEINDWLMSIEGKTYGGFTIQAMRIAMGQEELQNHDSAWGLDFGSPSKILLVFGQQENPENLLEHPMSVNMGEKMREFLTQYPDEIAAADENGFTLLHKEAIAGNKTNVEILLEMGADKTTKSPSNKSALDYAVKMNWEHVQAALR